MAEAEAVCVLHVCAPLDAAGWGLDKTASSERHFF